MYICKIQEVSFLMFTTAVFKYMLKTESTYLHKYRLWQSVLFTTLLPLNKNVSTFYERV